MTQRGPTQFVLSPPSKHVAIDDATCVSIPSSSGLMRKARSLDCFHRSIDAATLLSAPSPTTTRRILALVKMPEEKVCGENVDVVDSAGGLPCFRSNCGRAAAASRFSRAANRRFYDTGDKLASSESQANRSPEGRLPPTLQGEDEGVGATMLTGPGITGAGRIRLVNVAIISLLGLATAADLARRGVVTISQVDWGVDSSSRFYFDDLSTEGIDPPFRFAPPYRQNVSDKASKPRLGLGSAMIGSITTALSPILPFAGGMDLRRGEAWGLDEDNSGGAVGWIRGALDTLWEFGSPASEVSGWLSWPLSSSSPPAHGLEIATGVPRGGAAGGARSKAGSQSKDFATPTHRVLSLSAAEPFLPAKEIAELTLGDVTVAFRYAVESGRDGFDRNAFVKTVRDSGGPLGKSLMKALDAMDEATNQSRGAGIAPAKTDSLSGSFKEGLEFEGPISPNVGFGDVDALQFCAAMRLFAEWRLLRQVPEGYKGYAVGMGLGHKDVVQNVVKIENAVHDFLRIQDEQFIQDHKEPSCDNADGSEQDSLTCLGTESSQARSRQPHSPTIRDLLQYEIDYSVQSVAKLPRLKEKSAAMGLLWVRRQLHYQTAIFSNMLKVGTVFPDAIGAVRSAYSEVYGTFHGWAVQKIFNYSFQAAPEAEVIYKHMNPRRLKEVTIQAQKGEIDHVGEVRYENIESTESETVDIITSDGEKKRVSEDRTVSKRTAIEESWDGETSLSTAEEKIHTIAPVASHNFEFRGLNPTDAPFPSTEDETNSPKDKDGNPFVNIGLHVASEWEKMINHVGGECDKLGRHIGGEWDKLATNVVRLFHKDDGHITSSSRGTDIRGGASDAMSLSGEDLKQFVTRQITRDAHDHIERYLRIVRPLLADLAGLFDEMNMDDPTKV